MVTSTLVGGLAIHPRIEPVESDHVTASRRWIVAPKMRLATSGRWAAEVRLGLTALAPADPRCLG
jgi:hypothetical protein